jgi:hypothetical protein
LSGGPLTARKLDGGSIQGEAVIRIRRGTVSHGESFTLECEFQCTSGAREVWNGFLSEDAELPAQIVITSKDGAIRRELLVRRNEGPIGRPPTRWVLLRSTDTIGRELRVQVNEPGTDSNPDQRSDRQIDLAPGEYFVQAIFNHWLIGPRKQGDERDGPPQQWQNWSVEKMATPAAISEPVKLVVR